MQRKKKCCKECGREGYIFSKGRCKRCASLLYKKPKAKSSPTGEWELFMEIWKERKHVSFVSGKPLGDEPKPWMFAHVLPKGRHPELRLNKDNIVLLTFQEHFLLDHGTEQQRVEYGADWGRLYALREKLKSLLCS